MEKTENIVYDEFLEIKLPEEAKEPSPKIEEFLKLKKEFQIQKEKIERLLTLSESQKKEAVQKSADIAYDTCQDFFNDQTKEINERLSNKIIIKFFSFALIRTKGVKLRNLE